jgi:peptidoglycan/xylan/chitin deacetylase (PgdA/CDA1 family)
MALDQNATVFTGIAPLMYHSVAPLQDDPYQLTVRPERLDKQLHSLRRLGRTGTSVSNLLEARRRGSRERLVGLTFDDGYADFVENALPALLRYGFTATLFVLAGRLGGSNEWDSEGTRKVLLTADQLREAASAGIEIGSHGLQHVSLPSISDAELSSEICESRRILQEITGQDINGFCYPYGHFDERVMKTVEAAGYDYACAIGDSPYAGRYAIRRTHMRDGDSPQQLWLKNTLRSLLAKYRPASSLSFRSLGRPAVAGSCL